MHRVSDSQRTLLERATAVWLVLLAVLGVVSAPLCAMAQPDHAMHASIGSTQAAVSMRMPGMKSTALPMQCDDPCCDRSRPAPSPLQRGACVQHCMATAPAPQQQIAASAAGLAVPLVLADAVRVVPVSADRLSEAVRSPDPPLSFLTPLRI